MKLEQRLLKMLYDGDVKMQINMYNKNIQKEYTGVDVDFIDTVDKKPDCNINHFGYNFFFRTKKGINKQKYKTLAIAIRQIKNAIQRRWGTVSRVWIESLERNSETDKPNILYSVYSLYS